ncbi:MAG: chemotaxis protein CheV [Gammaproteobacteria bacterium]|nr:chemotaxis protein CheV [Gammaproteobacteria bacterium]
MTKLMQSVDERTRLAGTNRLEILLFSLGVNQKSKREEVFGINVFKVREVLHVPAITRAPDVPPGVEGMVSLRGTMIPVINLAHFCQLEVDEPPGILIVSEYNKYMIGFLVHSVEHILRMDWNQIKVPPPMMAHRMGGLITAVSELDDGRIVMVLDVEKILAETTESEEDEKTLYHGVSAVSVPKTVLFADDSSIARKQIIRTLEKMGLNYIAANNGLEAWDKLQELKQQAADHGTQLTDSVQVILTDVEMPEMDGYVLTKKIKDDSVCAKLPVVMHSSLSAEANVKLGRAVGADYYVPKFSPIDLDKILRKALGEVAE